MMTCLLSVSIYLLFSHLMVPNIKKHVLHRMLKPRTVLKPTNVSNYVMAFAQNYAPVQVAHFVDTFIHCHQASTRLVLFVSDKAAFQSRWNHHHVYFESVAGSGNPIFTRFYTYAAFVRANDTGAVTMLDARDLFFQGDVFEPSFAPGVHFFAENYTMDYVPNWNVPWVRDCVLGGNEMAQRMVQARMPIVNGGSVLCSNRTFALLFLEAMEKAIEANCNDQGYMDILAWTRPFGVNFTHIHLMQVDSWIGHGLQWPEATDVGLQQDSAGRIYSSSGVLFAALHQVDRNPRLASLWGLRFRLSNKSRGVLRPFRF